MLPIPKIRDAWFFNTSKLNLSKVGFLLMDLHISAQVLQISNGLYRSLLLSKVIQFISITVVTHVIPMDQVITHLEFSIK
jgi:hypothetical protein